MSDILTSQMLQASFRDVPFLVRSEASDAGRKIVLHEYLNSSERFVEDLGEVPVKFSVEAFVHGLDFRDNATRLETALRQEGAGRLVLPTFGALDVFALPYKKTAVQKGIGEIKFGLEFAVGRIEPSPVSAITDEREVFSLGDTTRQDIQAAFIELWEVPKDADNIAMAQSDLLATAQTAFNSFKDIVPSENLENMQRNITLFETSSPNFVRNAAALANNLIGGTPTITGLWQEISLGLSKGIGIDSLLRLSDFGSVVLKDSNILRGAFISEGENIPLWNPTTAGRIERNNNRLALVNVNRIASLVTSYEVAASSIYSTSEDINNVRLALEANHETLMRNDTIDSDILQSNDRVRDSVENLRIASLNVLEQKEQQVFKIDSIDIQRASSSLVQAYALYADGLKNEDELETQTLSLRGINPTKPAISLNGNSPVFKVQERA